MRRTVIGVLVVLVACGGGPNVENCTQALQSISTQLQDGANQEELVDEWEPVVTDLLGDAVARDATAEIQMCQIAIDALTTQDVEETFDDIADGLSTDP